MSDLSITSYVENFQTVYPKAKVAVRPSRKGFQVYIDGDRVGEPMTRSELEDAARHFRAPAPRAAARATAKLADMARLV